jgi:hypothetical protein
MLGVLVLAGLPGLSYSLAVGAAIAFLMLAVGISYRQTIRAHPQGGGSFIVASEELGRVRAVVAHWPTTSGPCTSTSPRRCSPSCSPCPGWSSPACPST